MTIQDERPAATSAAQHIRLIRARRKIEMRVASLIEWLDELDALSSDMEPSLGATDALDQRTAWLANLPGDDREDDPAEAGLGDEGGLWEQTFGARTFCAEAAI